MKSDGFLEKTFIQKVTHYRVTEKWTVQIKKPIYKGEVIRMINDRTNVIAERQFDNPIDADYFEHHLELMEVHFQRWSKGEPLYEENGVILND